jgi:hypothetical protein
MNQDNVKSILLSIEDAPMEFSVIFSGKRSKRVNGLYKSEGREIVIHNKNFTDDNLLLYTAIHEYAHHLHACTQGGTLPVRSHTSEFWATLHRLLEKAEETGAYKNVFAASPELDALTTEIRQRYLKENGDLLKGLGEALSRAMELCNAIGGRFEDYVDRVLRIPRTAATAAMKVHRYDIPSELGPDNMRFLASLGSAEKRGSAEASLLAGKSPDSVKVESRRRAPSEEGDPRERLAAEKARLERTIAALSKRLEEVNAELQEPTSGFQ